MTAASAPLVARLFSALADGEFHSGQDLARALAVSRSAIWKAVRALIALGATVHAVRNRGYRLATAAAPLDVARIRHLLDNSVRGRLNALDAAWSVGSTNSILLARPNPPAGCCEALLAEYQTAGRGRRGRSWLAPPGGAVCLSLSWTFSEVPRDLGALGLAIGVCALRSLESLGLHNVRLKWPNDLIVDGRKLGGVLIELRAESAGPACVVVGIGLNVALGPWLPEEIARGGLPPVDLVTAGLVTPDRNALAAALIAACVGGLAEFAEHGLRPFLDEWRTADVLRGAAVAVQCGERSTRGIARGIDLAGALLVETPQGVKRVISGDVSVRALP